MPPKGLWDAPRLSFTVAELVVMLQKYEPDTEVFVEEETGWRPIGGIEQDVLNPKQICIT